MPTLGNKGTRKNSTPPLHCSVLTALRAGLRLPVQLHLPQELLQEWSFPEWEEVRSPAPQTRLRVEAQRPPVYSSATLPPGTALGPGQPDRGLPRGRDPPLAPTRPPFVPRLGSLPRRLQWRSVARRPAPLGTQTASSADPQRRGCSFPRSG